MTAEDTRPQMNGYTRMEAKGIHLCTFTAHLWPESVSQPLLDYLNELVTVGNARSGARTRAHAHNEEQRAPPPAHASNRPPRHGLGHSSRPPRCTQVRGKPDAQRQPAPERRTQIPLLLAEPRTNHPSTASLLRLPFSLSYPPHAFIESSPGAKLQVVGGR